jgi:ABC-type branched-subunit amino acid transport system substrate-binding protein
MRSGYRNGSILGAVACAMAFLMLSAFAPGQAATAAAALTPQEEHGKRIFLEGVSPSGRPIYARIGRDLVRVPASVVPCGSCHGPDGLGRPEGGISPSDITWGNLTKAYGHRHPDGRSHQPFDENALASAIRARVDPAFHSLNAAMPQYEISDGDIAALIAYIKRLEGDLDPGLSETVIRIGALVPGPGPQQSYGEAITATLRAYFDEINAAGGIYGREIEIAVAERAASREATLANARRLIEQDPVFAVAAGFAAGMERDIFDLFETAGVPNVGPITLLPVPPGYADGAAFLPVSGLTEQARALVGYAAQNLGFAPGAAAVVHSGLTDADSLVGAVRRAARKHAWPEPLESSLAGGPGDAARIVGELSRAKVRSLFYFGSERGLKDFAHEAAKTDWRPLILLSGPLSARVAFELPLTFDGKVLLAYPNLPSDQSAAGIDELRRLSADHSLEKHHLATRISALVAAKILVEGLRRSGRALSRAKLVSSLEGLSKFDTGLTPPISFGQSRHVGARGAHVVAIDLQRRAFAPHATWVALD